ncbi:MAG: DUF4080 domain-containing protein, partial [Myxococcales bacterium]|nr:DUF4080 domain-containing protein [Myxococcales bacterium]
FPLEAFLAEMQTLIDRGAKQFKFVDRTFNLSIRTTEAILRFFLARMDQGLFVHFEMVPDRFPAQLRDLIAAFPPGAVQLEVGVQTLNPEVAARIERRQDNAKVLDNLTFLSSETGVHLHADLIVGLPGEDLASFARGFDLLLTTGVQEIQVGILKRLRGAPVNRLTHAHEMVYSPLPPYELLRNQVLSESEMAAMRRFARYWDVIANSGRFTQTLPLILAGESGFAAFSQLAGWLFARFQATHAVSLKRWVVALFGYLTDERGADPAAVAMALAADYRRVSRKEHVPAVLRPHLPKSERTIQQDTSHLPARQRRHVG